MKVAIYSTGANARAATIARAMQEGFRRHGVQSRILTFWDKTVTADLAVAYGWLHEPIFTAHANAGGQFLYWDLGYWNRHPKAGKLRGARDGHHRLAVNSWDTADHMARDCPHDRLAASPIAMQADALLHGRNTILVAGMSEKAAGTHGFRYRQWEDETIAQLSLWTVDDPGVRIEYRDKPPRGAPVEPIEEVLKRCRLVVSHHSNCAVDAMIAGVPWWAKKGVGRIGSGDLQRVVQQPFCGLAPAARQQLLADVAYAQWTPSEMQTGKAWDHIRGLLK